MKDQKKQKKYEEQLAKIKAEFDETREKDAKTLDDVTSTFMITVIENQA